jgi:hypothetical protein
LGVVLRQNNSSLVFFFIYHYHVIFIGGYMATAVIGAVILKEDSSSITYKEVCEDCGHQNSGSTERSQLDSCQRVETSFRCDRCGSRQDLIIKG